MQELMLRDEEYKVFLSDCVECMSTMPSRSVDFAMFSPPFPSIYSFTNFECDIGNSEDVGGEARLHFVFFFNAIRPLIKPGRVMMVHCTQLPRMKRGGGNGGMFDFRGMLIRLGERAGFVYEYDWLVERNPQSQAIRTRSRQLQFAGLESDRAQSRGAMGDYLIKFRAPGENAVPVKSVGDVSRNQWIEYAACSWSGIRDTETLNTAAAKSEDDTRHICPFALPVVDRLVRLYTNPDEIVFDPFTGIGSTGYVALKLGRRFVGCEIKQEYHEAALENLKRAIRERKESQKTLFDFVAAAADDDDSQTADEGDKQVESEESYSF